MDKLSAFAIDFCGERFLCDYSGALYWPRNGILVVSDLHLEKSSSAAQRGQLLPPYDSALTLNKLKDAIERYRPHTVISLGDSFHDREAHHRLAPEHRQTLNELACRYYLVWIAGNHDANVAPFAGQTADRAIFDRIIFCHEPSKHKVRGEVCGHLHPAAQVKRAGISVRRFCFVWDNDRLMLPAFGAYAGGLELTHKAFQGVFDHNAMVTCLLGKDQVYPIRSRTLRKKFR